MTDPPFARMSSSAPRTSVLPTPFRPGVLDLGVGEDDRVPLPLVVNVAEQLHAVADLVALRDGDVVHG